MTTPTELIAPRSAGTGQIRRLLAAIGAPVVAALRWLFQLTGLATSIVLLTPRWSTWRRTVRTEFARTLQHAVLGAFPATAAAAILIGVGLIYQALYWIEAAGQVDLLGRVIVVVLVCNAIGWPIHAARRASHYVLGGAYHGWFEAWDGLLSLLLAATIVWAGYHYVPEVRDLVQHLPDVWNTLRHLPDTWRTLGQSPTT